MYEYKHKRNLTNKIIIKYNLYLRLLTIFVAGSLNFKFKDGIQSCAFDASCLSAIVRRSRAFIP